jgi:hypothetical protein
MKPRCSTPVREFVPPGSDPMDYDVLTSQALAFKKLADESNSLEMLHRYESRYRRFYERALRNLQQIRENDPPLPNAPVFDKFTGPKQDPPEQPQDPPNQFCQTNPSALQTEVP